MKALTQTTLFFLFSITLNGQDLSGDWKGALDVQGKQLRLVVHVNKTSGQYEATLDSPDQNVSGIKVTKIVFAYPDVKFEISAAGAIYEGVMSDKGIIGKWVQSGTALFLVLQKNNTIKE
jgi:uncharacterized protein